MVLAPIAPIFVAFMLVESGDIFRKVRKNKRLIWGSVVIVILILSLFIFWNSYKSVKSQAYNLIPSYYNQQWQKAMNWVKENTPENSVFAHWWDYGYWVQTIG